MATDKPKQIQAIDLVKQVFEHIYGNLTLLRFSIEKLTPINGVQNNPDADKWEVIASFYQNLSSQQPTRYLINVVIPSKTVSFHSLDHTGNPLDQQEQVWQITRKEDGGP